MNPYTDKENNKSFSRPMVMCYITVYVIVNQGYLMDFTELTDRYLSDICLRDFLTANEIIILKKTFLEQLKLFSMIA